MKVKKAISEIKTPVLFSLAMILLCGVAYPLLMTGIGQLLFPAQANGSLVYVNGEPVGSSLIGQTFEDPRFMKSRPSAINYNMYAEQEKLDGAFEGAGTGSDNYAASNPELWARVEADLERFLEANPTVNKGDIPADLLTSSGSGLDPHISPASAALQIPALAENTGLSVETLEQIVKNNTSGKFLGIFGEETVNVLLVNLEIAKALGII